MRQDQRAAWLPAAAAAAEQDAVKVRACMGLVDRWSESGCIVPVAQVVQQVWLAALAIRGLRIREVGEGEAEAMRPVAGDGGAGAPGAGGGGGGSSANGGGVGGNGGAGGRGEIVVIQYGEGVQPQPLYGIGI